MGADEQAAYAARRASDRLAATLAAIATQAKTRRATGFVVPVVDDDPAADDPTNLWLFGDGQLNTRTPDGAVHRYPPAPSKVPTFASDPTFSSGHRIWLNGTTGKLCLYLANGTVERWTPDASSTSTAGGDTGGTTTVPKPADPKPTKHTETYGSTWEKAYCSKHGKESDLYFGYFPGAHGERRDMFGFDWSTIQSDLAGATITKVEIQAKTSHTSFSGATIHWGTHTQGSEPGSYSANRTNVYVGDWPESGWGGGSDRWRQASKSIGEWFRDGRCKGLTIDNATSTTAYGELAKNTLALRISYVTYA